MSDPDHLRERLQQKALEQTGDGIMLLAGDGTVLHVNPAMSRMTGLPQKTLLENPRRLVERLSVHAGLSLEDVIAVVRTSGRWAGEVDSVGADGHAVLLDVKAVQVWEGADPPGVVVMARDVTRERTLLRESAVSQQMVLVQNLAIGIAHEFKNLLTVILAYATLLDDEVRSTTGKEGIKGILDSVDRANDLLTNLQAVARRTVPRVETLNLQTVLSEVVSVLGKGLPDNIRLYAPENPELPAISADTTILYRALLNLCMNACEAMPEGGTITIEADRVRVQREDLAMWPDRKPGDYVILSVTDTGRGMTADVKKRIFEPFFTTRKQAAGLGLSVVQHTMGTIGGWVSVYSEAGVGSCFRLYIPVSQAAEPPAAGPSAEEPPGGDETILVVDDDPLTLSVARRILECAGYTVVPAGGGREALAAFGEHGESFSLVVLDVVMPYMNGRELRRELVRRRPDMKVLAVSGFASRTAKELLEEPGVEFLPKPFTHAQLCAAVRRVLDGV